MAALPPLPPPWTLKTSSKGKPYYFNPLTGESSWTPPPPPLVAAHYDRVAGSAGRSATDALDAGARAAINFCKARLMAEAAAAQPWSAVVDLCCGRGGDLDKFRRLGVQSLLCVDAAPAALAEAQARAAAAGGGMRTTFLPPGDAAAAQLPQGAADAVVCNLALHYFAESPARLAALLGAVARCLKPGGVFLGVMADARALLARGTRACVQGQRSFGNALYRVDMQDSLVQALGSGGAADGLSYTFALPQSGRMDACAEFVLTAEALRDAAQQHGLVAADGGENLSVMLERLHGGGAQAQRLAMRVPARPSADELELVSFYTTFVLNKRHCT